MNRETQARRPRPTNRDSLSYAPSLREVDHLISRASEHPLGLEFLKAGSLDAVSAAFEVHAFVVDRARDRLK